MKLFRYRKPSLNTIVGITAVKKSIRKVTGLSTIDRFTKPSRIKQSIKQKVGIYSPTMTVVRQSSRGNIPTLFGLFKKLLPAIAVLLMIPSIVEAKSGCCSSHGGVSCSAGPQGNGNVICNDGWTGSSCAYSEMVMCGGSTTTTTASTPTPTPKPATPKPTPKPSPIQTPTPTPSPSPSPELPSPSPSVAPVVPSPSAEIQGATDSKSTTSAGEAIAGLGTLGAAGWGGVKLLKKIVAKLVT